MTRIYQLIQQLETLTETIDAAQQRAGQMDAQFQPGSISVLKSKTDPTHPADGQLVGESDVTEGRVDSPVSNAIIHRLVNQRPALLARFGPEVVMAAVDEVAEWVGDVDEIGSSDVSGWVADVERYLRTSAGEGIAEANPNQQISRYNPDGNTYKGSANKMPVLDPRDPVHNADRFGPEHDEPYDQDDYDKAELKSILAKQMESLSKVQRIVIKARFYDDMTFDQIANRLDITKERVRQIEAAGLRKLLHSNRSNVLRAFAEQGVAESDLNEFAPAGSGDGGDDGFSEEILKKLAAQWWNGDEDPKAEKTLLAAGWEIGQDEGYDNGGVFVVQAGDEHGKSYISWPAEELEQAVAEGYAGIDDTDTVGFSVNSEAAYTAVMKRFGDVIDHDETSGIMYAPARVWPEIEMTAFDADGEGATRDDGMTEGLRDPKDNPCWKGYKPVGTKKKADTITLMPLNLDEVKADPTGSWVVYGGSKVMKFKTHGGAKAYAQKNGGKVASSEFYADKIQGVKEAETDYSKRRQRERDVDAGRPVAKPRQPRMTDYQKRRAQDKKDMELGEEKTRLDPKCWSGKKIGNPKTKVKGGEHDAKSVSKFKGGEYNKVAEALSPQQKQAHQANLDAAQREMDRREAEGEDMTGAKIDQKTYKIIKPKQSGVSEGSDLPSKVVEMIKKIARSSATPEHKKAAIDALVAKYGKKGVAEADRVDVPKPKGPNESDPWRQGWVAWFERNSNNPYEKGTAEHSKWKDGFDDAGLQPDYYNENSANTNTPQGQLPEAADRNQMDTPEFRQALANLKKKAAQGPSKVAWDPNTSRYRVVPVNDNTMKESVTKEDIITKLKSTLGDYLSDVAQAVRKDSDLKDPGSTKAAPVGAVKTIMTDDGHEIRIHGNEDDGFRITIKNKDASAKFASLSEAEMAANLYCAKRRQTPAAQAADYVSEENKDACYHKVKSRYKVWPSAYASGALVQCRKKGAKNWGNKS